MQSTMLLVEMPERPRLPTAQLNIVFCAIILSRILYALPAWGGFLTVELTTKIDAFLRKAVKWGYSQKVTSLSECWREIVLQNEEQ